MSSPELVGLVVVSHSRPLAEAALELALQMVHGPGLRTAIAAGTGDGALGTDATAIAEAMAAVDSPAGVVVLMDLGSAVLSADLALDLAEDPTLRERVTLSSAPLVEGLVAAAVTAAGGATRAQVAAEAANALAGKRADLDEDAPEPAPAAAPGVPVPGVAEATAEIEVTLAHGLHARPVARLAGVLGGLDAVVTVTNLSTGAGPAPASSPTGLTLLGARHGHRLRVDARGPDAARAVERLVALAARSFDEDPEPAVAAAPPRAPGAGVGASPGLVVGPVVRLRPPRPDLEHAPEGSGDPAVETARLAEAVEVARAQIAAVRARTAAEVGEGDAAIFDAHAAFLADPVLQADAAARIAAGADAARAWAGAVASVEQRFAELADPYLRARGADVRAVGAQVLGALLGTSAAPLPAARGVLVAEDLTPGQTAALDPAVVQGIVLARGSRTSHAAILARARGIAAVVGAGEAVLDLAEGRLLVLDGDTGTVVVDPDEATVADVRSRAGARAEQRERARAAAGGPAVTVDGTTIVVACNVGSATDASTGAAQGADGSGLVRTELCFLDRTDEPSVAEQESLYRSIAAAIGGRRITLRTLDVGGDKPLPYLPVPAEDNPFLGLRGLRLGLVREPVLRRQLVAVVRTARTTPVSLMFPMVTTRDELVRARGLLAAVIEEEGARDAVSELRVGVMVEVPALALRLATVADLVDFVSIGTNDLTQYALAAERGNPAVAGLHDPLDPGVLALIAATTAAARGRFAVAVCGEAAADPVAVPLLLGLGVDELSVSPFAVPAVKAQVRGLDLARCRSLAQQALAQASAREVRDLVAAAGAGAR